MTTAGGTTGDVTAGGLAELPPWLGAGENKPAPGPLLLVQVFVNTWEGDTGIDLLADAETGASWLRAAGLAGPQAPLPVAALRQAIEVREALRALLAHNGGEPPPADEELEPLTALAEASHPRLSVGPDGLVGLAPGPDGSLTDGLAGLLLIVRDAQQSGLWPRLKACRNPECHWAFFDRSHAHRGAWCEMATCGNKIKNRNLRARQRA
ncbi:MAG TPA: CGNR zinc finger domain-containing protein [Streptosporangiaceae bacterium]|jgi:predicted RNA-binding Zn ribbon-like protein|nr:CGNR zinc finger domain-containing protein [Streptosporangiaceae bacterium]